VTFAWAKRETDGCDLGVSNGPGSLYPEKNLPNIKRFRIVYTFVGLLEYIFFPLAGDWWMPTGRKFESHFGIIKIFMIQP
jgi:hypothetical protein